MTGTYPQPDSLLIEPERLLHAANDPGARGELPRIKRNAESGSSVTGIVPASAIQFDTINFNQAVPGFSDELSCIVAVARL
jgi:hypothetical protein